MNERIRDIGEDDEKAILIDFIKSVRNVLTCRGTYNQPDLYHCCYHPSQPNQSKYVQI